jgi:hypothetical protein
MPNAQQLNIYRNVNDLKASLRTYSRNYPGAKFNRSTNVFSVPYKGLDIHFKTANRVTVDFVRGREFVAVKGINLVLDYDTHEELKTRIRGTV